MNKGLAIFGGLVVGQVISGIVVGKMAVKLMEKHNVFEKIIEAAQVSFDKDESLCAFDKIDEPIIQIYGQNGCDEFDEAEVDF